MRTSFVIERGLAPAPAVGVAVTVISRVLVRVGGALRGGEGEGRAGVVPGTGLGLKEADIPVGRPLTEKETSPFDPLRRFMSTGRRRTCR